MFGKYERQTDSMIKSIPLHLIWYKGLMVDEAIYCQGIQVFSDLEQVLMF